MSRIGKKPVVLPSGVTAELKDSTVTVKGPKGSLNVTLHPKVKAEVTAESITVDVQKKEDKVEKALWGLSRALIQNLVLGVTTGYSKKLEVNGVGFKIALSGKKLTLNLGFSHPIDVEIPQDIDVVVEKNVITISGIDKQKVGQLAANIRRLKEPEPYKGKGIKYEGEVILRKAGKVVKAVGK